MAASAKRNNRSSGESECVAGHVFDDYVVSHDAIRAIVDHQYCGFILIAHQFSPFINVSRALADGSQELRRSLYLASESLDKQFPGCEQ
jgi:hypothetical protein